MPKRNRQQHVDGDDVSFRWSSCFSSNTTKNSNEHKGQRLLNLLKRIDKKLLTTVAVHEDTIDINQNMDDDNDNNDTIEEDVFEETVVLMKELVSSCQRNGLLQGNINLAETILSTSSSSSVNGMINSSATIVFGNKKGKNKRRNGNKNSFTNGDIPMDTNNNSNNNNNNLNGSSSNNSAPVLDVQLLLSSIIRILENNALTATATIDEGNETGEKKKNHTTTMSFNNNYDYLLLIALAADFCTACSESIKSRNDTICSTVEYELLSNSGKLLLIGLEKRIREILALLKQQQQQQQEQNMTNNTTERTGRKEQIINNNSNNNNINGKEEKQPTSTTISFAFVQPEILLSSSDIATVGKYTLVACLRACSSLVSLFGTKLSRSMKLITHLKQVGWEVLLTVIENECSSMDSNSIKSFATATTTKAAAYLLSTLPLAGGLNGQTPEYLWNQSLMNNVRYASTLMEHISPRSNNSPKKGSYEQQKLANGTNANAAANSSSSTSNSNNNYIHDDIIFNQWLTEVCKSDEDFIVNENYKTAESIRLVMVLQGINGIIELLVSLLSPTWKTDSMLQYLIINVDTVLHLIQQMISYASIVENKYRRTKKRLRQHVIVVGVGTEDYNDNTNTNNDPLFSISTMVHKIAYQIKLYGYKLLQSFLEAIGTTPTVLLPFARYVRTIAYNGMVQSSSIALQQIIDPSSSLSSISNHNTNNNTTKEEDVRWSHTSIILRRMAIETYRTTIRMFGIDPVCLPVSSSMISSSSSSSSRILHDTRIRNDVDRAITIVCGCLVEELSYNGSTTSNTSNYDNDNSWGSTYERIQLVSTALACLSECLKSGGEYLRSKIRTLIDSIIYMYLQSVSSATSKVEVPIVLQSTCTKIAILETGMASVCVPLPDGSLNSISNELIRVATKLRHDRDSTVASVAASVHTVCCNLRIARAPAVVVVTQSSTRIHHQYDDTSSNNNQQYQYQQYQQQSIFTNTVSSATELLKEIQSTRNEIHNQARKQKEEKQTNRKATIEKQQQINDIQSREASQTTTTATTSSHPILLKNSPYVQVENSVIIDIDLRDITTMDNTPITELNTEIGNIPIEADTTVTENLPIEPNTTVTATGTSTTCDVDMVENNEQQFRIDTMDDDDDDDDEMIPMIVADGGPDDDDDD